MHGFTVVEVPVGHHPRTAGRSKYGVMNRAFRAFRDLLAVRWMRSRLIRLPIASIQSSRGAVELRPLEGTVEAAAGASIDERRGTERVSAS